MANVVDMDFVDFLQSQEFLSIFGCTAMRPSSVDIIVQWMMDKGKSVSAKEFAALSKDEVQKLKDWFRAAWQQDIRFWLSDRRLEGVMPERMIARLHQNNMNALNEDEKKLIRIWEYTKQQNLGTHDDKQDRPPAGKKLKFTYRNSYFVDLS